VRLPATRVSVSIARLLSCDTLSFLNPLFKGPFATTKPSNIYCTKLHAHNLAMVFTISLPECVGLADCVWCSKLTTPSRSSYPLVLLTAVGGYWLNFWQVSGLVALLCRWY